MKYYTNGKIFWRINDGQLEGFHGQTQSWKLVGKRGQYNEPYLLKNDIHEISYEDVMLELI
jgi:hypothetical protein